jgi:mRNA interferase HicA
MKKKDLEKRLSRHGWWFDRHGGNHDVWTNGEIFESVPRHNEVNENLAKKILKKAEINPPKNR